MSFPGSAKKKSVLIKKDKCVKSPVDELASHFSCFLDTAIASPQARLPIGWLVHWLIGCWLVGPLVHLSRRDYRGDAANLGWIDSQLPLQSLLPQNKFVRTTMRLLNAILFSIYFSFYG